MVGQDFALIDIDQQFVPQVPHYVADCVFGEGNSTKAQLVVCQIFLCNVPQHLDAILPSLCQVVIALFEFTPSLILGVLRHRLRG